MYTILMAHETHRHIFLSHIFYTLHIEIPFAVYKNMFYIPFYKV